MLEIERVMELDEAILNLPLLRESLAGSAA